MVGGSGEEGVRREGSGGEEGGERVVVGGSGGEEGGEGVVVRRETTWVGSCNACPCHIH